MENHDRSSDQRSVSEWIASLIDVVLSYYANLISHPFKSGLAYFLAGLLPALFVGWILFPVALYSEQAQPINFNHVIHSDEEITEGDTELERCMSCHGFREDGSFVGVPKLEKCMECHDDPDFALGEDPEEEKFLKEYVATKKEVPWLVYSRQPDCVYFSHIAHVKMGKMECRTCHGEHGYREKPAVYQENRLTGISRDIWGKNIAGIKFNTWDAMKMDDCAKCHTKEGLEENNACFVCHK